MRNRLILLVTNGFIWLISFQLARALFFIYQGAMVAPHPAILLIDSGLHGLRMDLAMMAYLLVIPALALLFTFHRWRWLYPFLAVYRSICVLCVVLIVVCDLPVYQAWGFRLNTTPLHYLSSPKEAFASASAFPLPALLLLFVGVSAGLWWCLWKSDQYSILKFQPVRFLPNTILFLSFSALLVIPIRGGFQTAPMNESIVYHSSNNFANHLAVNAPWIFFSSVINRSGSTENPFIVMSEPRADSLLRGLLPRNEETVYQVKADSATNVVLIIWESLTAKAVHSLGGLPGVTPGLAALSEEGILFTNLYASGDRSDKGLIAVLSGYPAQPTKSIIKIPGKTASLPSLPKTFGARGYSTSFYYGGETEFANIKSYLLQQGYDRIVSKDSFSPDQMGSNWGAHDHVVYDKLLADLNHAQSPFFTTLFTLSSHEPYQVPVPTVIPGDDSEHQFMNAMHYADASFYDFIQKAKQTNWWQNTLVVVVADHGHPLPRLEGGRPREFHIPMLWLGGALQAKGIRWDSLASQTDLATTLLAQFRIDHAQYRFSNDIFNKTRTSYAFFSFNNGFSFIKPRGWLVYDNVGKRIIDEKGMTTAADLLTGQAYLQNLFADYLKR